MKYEFKATDRDRAVLSRSITAVHTAHSYVTAAKNVHRDALADLTAMAAAIIADLGGPKPGDEVKFVGKPYRIKKAASSAVTSWGAVRVSFRCCNIRRDGTEGARERALLVYVEMAEEGGES